MSSPSQGGAADGTGGRHGSTGLESGGSDSGGKSKTVDASADVSVSDARGSGGSLPVDGAKPGEGERDASSSGVVDGSAGAAGGGGTGNASNGGTAGLGGNAGAAHDGGSTSTGGQGGGAAGSGGTVAGNGGNGGNSAGAGGLSCGVPSGGTGTGGSPQPVARRLPVPCVAPLPTGYCVKSDDGDNIGNGMSSSGSGAGSVEIVSGGSGMVHVTLVNVASNENWDAVFAPPLYGALGPGIFDPAAVAATVSTPQISVRAPYRGCITVTGKFSVEEFRIDPATGFSRASITFEQHCNGTAAALRGVVNYQATGNPDPTPTVARTLPFTGKIFRVVYDPAENLVYGLDATNKKLAKLDLTSGSWTYADVVQVPNDACLDKKRGRLFVVDRDNSLITEYRTSDLKPVRDITWTGTYYDQAQIHFKIRCGPDKLYVVDADWAPELFTVDLLDGSNPTVTNTGVSSVGGLTLDSSASDLYYWWQYGWNAGSTGSYVYRLETGKLKTVDQSTTTLSNFARNPFDAPLLLDECRGRLFVKNKIFDAKNLATIIYTLPSTLDSTEGASENAYALDSQRGRMATKGYIYELSRYNIVIPTAVPGADQLFFDKNGTLWFLSVASGALKSQVVP